MEVYTPVALVCYERALPTAGVFPPPAPITCQNQLTYLRPRRARGTGRAAGMRPKAPFFASGFPLCVDSD